MSPLGLSHTSMPIKGFVVVVVVVCGDRIQLFKIHNKHVMNWPISAG